MTTQRGSGSTRAVGDVFVAGTAGRRWRRLLGHLDVLAVIALGGAIGSSGRYLVAVALPASSTGIPWATLLANITGCLTLGALLVFVLDLWRPTRYLRPFLGVGVLGGFTTFSAVSAETLELLRAGVWPLACAYLVGSAVLGLLACWLGVTLARTVIRVTRRRRTR